MSNPVRIDVTTIVSDMSQKETRNTVALDAGSLRKQRIQDYLFHKLTLAFALFAFLILAGIIVALMYEAWPALKEFGPAFITTVDWDPVNHRYGAAIAICGTLITSIIALLIAVPLSFGIAVFLTELCPAKLKRPMGACVELLAGIPSIIYGMWGPVCFCADFFQNMFNRFCPALWGRSQGLAFCLAAPRWAWAC